MVTLNRFLIIKEINETEVALNACGLNDDIAYQRDGNTLTNEFTDDTGQSIDDYSATFQFNGNNEMTFDITNKSTRFELIDETGRITIFKKYSNGRAIKISNSEILKQWKQDTLIVD